MAFKGRKKKKKKAAQSISSVESSRVDLLYSELQNSTLESVSDPEMEAISTRILAEEDWSLLGLLNEIVSGSAQEKILRKMTYTMKQRGIDTSQYERTRKAVSLGVSASEQIVLMAPPSVDATRIFNLVRPMGGTVRIVEVYFRKPQGLYRLVENSADKHSWRQWLGSMTTPQGPGVLPERVKLKGEMGRRKVWEIARCLRKGEMGPEVDKALARKLIESLETEPKHPGSVLSFEGVKRLDIDALAHQTEGLAFLDVTTARRPLEEQWEELGGHLGVDTGSRASLERQKKLRKMATDMVKQWHDDQLWELFMDAAMFYDSMGEREVAATLIGRSCEGEGADRKSNMERIITDYLYWRFNEKTGDYQMEFGNRE